MDPGLAHNIIFGEGEKLLGREIPSSPLIYLWIWPKGTFWLFLPLKIALKRLLNPPNKHYFDSFLPSVLWQETHPYGFSNRLKGRELCTFLSASRNNSDQRAKTAMTLFLQTVKGRLTLRDVPESSKTWISSANDPLRHMYSSSSVRTSGGPTNIWIWPSITHH